MSDFDFDVVEFAALLAFLPEPTFDPDVPSQDDTLEVDEDSDWTFGESIIGWFLSQVTTGSGAYSRGIPNHSAKKTYTRLQSPEGLIWIAGALGADPEFLQVIADKAEPVPWRSRSAFVRKHLPWSLIADLVEGQLMTLQSSEEDWDAYQELIDEIVSPMD